jgi:propionyl-CoA carboxylase alpha chain
MKQLVSSSFR